VERRTPERPGRRLATEAAHLLVLPAVLAAAVYLGPFALDATTMPFGRDTPGYVWRVDVVHGLGVDALTRPTAEDTKSLAERPAFLVVASLQRAVLGADAFTSAWFLPAVSAAAIALAAAAFAAWAVGEDRRRAGWVGIAVATSAFVAWTAVGYATNLALDAIALALAVVAARAVAGGRGLLAIAVLVVGAALTHWPFAVVACAIVLTWLLALLTVRRAGGTDSEDRRRATLVAGALVGGALAGAIALWTVAPSPPPGLPSTPADPSLRIAERLPAMAFPLTLPLAGLGGAIAIAGARDARGRWSVGLLIVWSAASLVGLALWTLGAVRAPPPYRTVAFALGVPALIALGALAARRRLLRDGDRLRRLAGDALVVVCVGGLAAAGTSVWFGQPSRTSPEERAQLATLSSYLEGAPPDAGIAVLVPPRHSDPPESRVLSGIPPERVPSVRMLDVAIDAGAVRDGSLVPGADVVVVLEAFAHRPPPAGTELGPGVWLLRGPAPGTVVPGSAARVPAPAALVGLWAGALGVLLAAGAGWSRALTDLGPLGSTALAPAFGLAVLGTVGTLASRIGVPLGGVSGVAVVLAVGVLGWAAAILSDRRRRASRPG
jgi:hypothetical protein